jgi:uncharacterized membrane protein
MANDAHLSVVHGANKRTVNISQSCIIRRSADDVYRFWRKLENLSQLVNQFIAITRRSDTVSHWSVKLPGDGHVEWDAEIVDDQPGCLIAWRSREGGDITNAGSVHFEPAPDEHATKVTFEMDYQPPGGKLGAAVAKLAGHATDKQFAEALQRLKVQLEKPVNR